MIGKKFLEWVVYVGENQGKKRDGELGNNHGKMGRRRPMKEAIHVKTLLLSKLVGRLITAICSVFLLNSIPRHFLVENNSVGVQHTLCA